jgi:beta-lactam-binding protein with PASTA domain
MSPRPRWPYRRRRVRAGELPPDLVEPPPPDPTLTMPGPPPPPVPPGPPAPPYEEPPPSRELWPWLLLFGVLVLAGLAIAWALSRDDKASTTTVVVVQSVRVPAVTGLREPEAVARINQAGLKSAISRQRSDRPEEIVLLQRPPAGTSLRRGSVVTLVVSSGRPPPSTVRVPAVVGLARAKAERLLSRAELRAQTRLVSSGRPTATVIAQDPAAGASVIRNSIVALTVSKGQQRVSVPEVVGRSEAEGRIALRSAGLLASVFLVASDRPEGTVIAQDPKGGERVAKGSNVRLNVSKGAPTTTTAVTVTTARTVTETTPATTTTATTTAPPRPRATTVPDVRGLNQRVARRTLRRAGLLAAVVYIKSSEPENTVIAQFPKPGVKAKRGARVRINISLGANPKPQATIPDVTGVDENSATTQLQRAGFAPETFDQETTDPSEDGVVLFQDPAGGTRAPRGALVTIYVGRYTG